MWLQGVEHYVQTHQPVLGVVEGFWDGGENLEAQQLPEMHSRVVGLDAAFNWMLW